MQINIRHNFPELKRALEDMRDQVPYATMVALNKTAAIAQEDVRKEMRRVFDRPTPWVLNSLRIKYAKKTSLEARVAFKDNDFYAIGANTMIDPHLVGGKRQFKAMEVRLRQLGALPDGWNAVPGGAADLDGYGNMSRGQISQLLNVLGAYQEAGYNKANHKTKDRLAKGTKRSYGFEYCISYGTYGRKNYGTKPGGRLGYFQSSFNHLPAGVWKRVKTGFGSSLKPVLIFVKGSKYKARLAFSAIVQAAVDKNFPTEFNTAYQQAMATAKPKAAA
jgi:hypothetical protein